MKLEFKNHGQTCGILEMRQDKDYIKSLIKYHYGFVQKSMTLKGQNAYTVIHQ